MLKVEAELIARWLIAYFPDDQRDHCGSHLLRHLRKQEGIPDEEINRLIREVLYPKQESEGT